MEQTIAEVSKKHSPTGQRYLAKPYLKDNDPAPSASARPGSTPSPSTQGKRHRARRFVVRDHRGDADLSQHLPHPHLPAVKASGVDFSVRVHDLRHTHASWLLAGGADLKSVMERMGHSQSQTTQKYSTPSPTPTNATSTR